MLIEKLILDADICIKIGSFEKIPLLEIIIPKLTEKAFIHQYFGVELEKVKKYLMEKFGRFEE